MNLIPNRSDPKLRRGGPLLVPGDRMGQAEFHRRYSEYPEDTKFELIGGIVYMASPLRMPHSNYNEELVFALGLYRRATPGVESMLNATAILGEQSEPQPDLGLRILQEYGGRSTITKEKYVAGPPEFLVEIAHATRALDMNAKRADYLQAGVQEYLVLCVEEQEIHWFDFASGDRIVANRRGVLRSRVFPGLWLHERAVLRCDSARIREVVEQGLASRSHAAFVKRLEAARRRLARRGDDLTD